MGHGLARLIDDASRERDVCGQRHLNVLLLFDP
jgi:hypothetical protein